MGHRKGAYRVLVGRPYGKRPLGITRCRWEDNIKMDLQEVGWDGMDQVPLTEGMDRWWTLVSAVRNLPVP
jgi:hypothetical protein